MLPTSLRRQALASSRSPSSFRLSSSSLRRSSPSSSPRSTTSTSFPVASTSKLTFDVNPRRSLSTSTRLSASFLQPSAPLFQPRRTRLDRDEEDGESSGRSEREGGEEEGKEGEHETEVPNRRPGSSIPANEHSGGAGGAMRDPSSTSSSSSSSSSFSSAGSSAGGDSTPPSSDGGSGSSSSGSSTGTSISRRSVPDNYPQVLALPITRRPLFPGFYKAVVINDKEVIKAIKESLKRGQPYIGAFLLKDEDADSDV